jgi:hypothetical protein
VLWLPSRHRAERIERSMQKSVGPHLSPADHHGDGHSERFDGVAHPSAIRMLGQMPVDVGTESMGKLLPLELALDLEEASAGEISPLEVWWTLEDLWWRAAQCMAVTANVRDRGMRVIVHRLRASWDGPSAELRRSLLDLDT